MAERTGSPIDAARPTTFVGGEIPQAEIATSDNYRDLDTLRNNWGSKWLIIQKTTPDYYAPELDQAESRVGY